MTHEIQGIERGEGIEIQDLGHVHHALQEIALEEGVRARHPAITIGNPLAEIGETGAGSDIETGGEIDREVAVTMDQNTR